MNELTGGHAALLLAWYTAMKRDLPWRRTLSPYAIWVSEVMLQQTQVKTVIPYYERFIQRFPSVEQLGAASLEEVLLVWRGLGYYSRARRMWEGAHYLLEQQDGKMPKDYEALLRVPGIGKYTAGAIASIAFGQRVTAIDGNVLRVVARLIAWSEPVETARSYRRFNEQLLVWQPVLQPGDFNQALMELGALVCTPTMPDCPRCPLSQVCEGYRRSDVQRYPVKRVKAKRQVVTRLTFILRQGDRVFLQKRPAQGLLANLWEFPGVELSEEDALNPSLPVLSDGEWLEHLQRSVPEQLAGWLELEKEQLKQELKPKGPVWYTFSHRRWKICWVIVNCSDSIETKPVSDYLLRESAVNSESGQQHRDNWCWVSVRDLGGMALPVAFKAVVEDLNLL